MNQRNVLGPFFPISPSRRRLDIDGVVGIACALMLPVALLLL